MSKLNKVFQIRLSESDLNLAKRLAQKNKMTLADFIRFQIFEKPIKTVQSTLELEELKRQGLLLKQSITSKKVSAHLEKDIREHLRLLASAIKLWIEANDPKIDSQTKR